MLVIMTYIGCYRDKKYNGDKHCLSGYQTSLLFQYMNPYGTKRPFKTWNNIACCVCIPLLNGLCQKKSSSEIYRTVGLPRVLTKVHCN